MRIAAAACLILLPQAAVGEDQDLASLHQFNGMAQLRRKLRLVLHSRIRFNNNISDFFQFRAGPILFWDWKPRLQWQTGYYIVEQRSGTDTVTIQRPWAGAQIRAYENGRFGVDWRNLIERHMISGPGDFTRFRTRAMVNFTPKVGWQPFISAEALVLKGTAVGRYTGGLNYATAGGHLIGLGYEFRQDVGRPGAHVIATFMQFRLRGPRERQKPGASEVPQ
jgi:hypothetical protein